MADSVGHTHTHLCTPLSTVVGGKTANAVIQQSGIKWTLHRDSHVRARMHACIVHAETHAHTQRGGQNDCQTAGELDRKPSIYS